MTVPSACTLPARGKFSCMLTSTIANHDSDGNIRYYEYTNDEFIYLSEYKSTDPQRGVAFIPRRGLSVHENEVMKAYKTVNDTHIEPISFIVPRRVSTMHDKFSIVKKY